MGPICCNNNTRINQTRLITIEEHPHNMNDKQNINNEQQNEFEEPNVKLSFYDIENNMNTTKQYKRISEKRITKGETINHVNKNRIELKPTMKISNDIKKKRKSFAIPMDNSFKNKFLYQKKISLKMSSNNLIKNNKTHKFDDLHHKFKLYQIPPRKSLFKKESSNLLSKHINDINNINNFIKNNINNNSNNCSINNTNNINSISNSTNNISNNNSLNLQINEIKNSKINDLKESNLFDSINNTNMSRLKLDDSKNKTTISLSPCSSMIKKKKHDPIELINKKLSGKQRQTLIDILKDNELLDDNMTESFINMILNTLVYKRIKDNIIIFDQNSKYEDIYYIIEKGKIEYGIDDDIYEITKLNGISTQALLKYSKKKCYIKTVGRCYLFELPLEKYRKFVNDYEKRENEEKFWNLKRHFFFAFTEDDKLKELVKECPIIKYDKNSIILEADSLIENVYYILTGEVEAKRNDINVKILNEGEIFGEIGLFNQIESLYQYSAESECTIIEINFEDIFMYLGENCIQNFVFELFNDAIKNDEFLSFSFTNKIIKDIYNSFQLKFFYNDTILSKNQKKIVLPICGTIIKSKKQAKDITNILEVIKNNYSNRLITGIFFTDAVTRDINIMFNLIGDESIVFECEWYEIINKLITNELFHVYQITPIDLIQSFIKISLFKYISPYKMYQIMNSIKEQKYKNGQIILKDGPKSEQFFYIFNGEVNLNINGVVLKVLTKGQSFGDITSDIINYTQKTTFISKKQTILFSLDKDNYNDIVKKSDFFLRLFKITDKNDISISIKNLYYITDLGSGSFGKVYLVHNKKKLFALKSTEINEISKNKQYAQLILNEKTIMAQVEHPFIVRLTNTFKTKDYLFFLMEYINGINMRKYLELKENTKLRNLQEVKFISGILFSVLHYLSQRKIIHRDLKPDNLMMDKNGYIKVIDFGVAKYLKEKNYTNTVTGTPHYMSPEVILCKPYSFEVDYWSVGIILYEIFYGRVPFGYGKDSINDIYQDIIESNIHLPSVKENENFNNLIKVLLHKIPSNRISSFKMIKNHIFFKDFDFEGLLNYTYEPPFKPEKNLISANEKELIQNLNMPFVIFMKNNIYQSVSDIDENFIQNSKEDVFNNF